ncbi:MAG: nucleic acid-binding protein [Methanospirillaceae archaeon]|nr:nucleic acid-binding protein [Methanospirillaceae archaeon]
MAAPQNTMTRRYEREPARRVFAAELRETTYQFKDGTEEMSPSYILLPTGERCNRVFIVGTITEKRRSEGENVFYQIRIVDPTGTFFISAGSYQPEALQQLSSIETPEFVAVIGKPNLFESPDGRTLISVRAESITKVDRSVRDCWILDAAERTLERIEATETTPDRQTAQEKYPQRPEVWYRIISDALATVEM